MINAKNRTECEEYDTSSPFPPTKEQVHQCGQVLGNSVAALFAQQGPAAEISFAVVVAEELRLFSRPIMDFAMHQFRKECSFNSIGDVNLTKAAANKALNSLDKILIINNHYQLMSDFNVWDVYNPPSLEELKLLATRYPFQPISALMRKEVDSYKNHIHEQLKTIYTYRESNTKYEEREVSPSKHLSHQEDYCRVENNIVFNVRGGKFCAESNSRDFTICMNELVAFYINSEAKFTKVYAEGVNKCFLMPAEFKNEAMRKFFSHKFDQFRESRLKLSKKLGEVNLAGVQTEFIQQEMDFAEEHLERRSLQQQYLQQNSPVHLQELEAECRRGL